MFSDESNKLETYTYLRTKWINILENTNLFVDQPILKYIYSLFGPTTKINIYIYIYIYIYMCVCVCVCVCVCIYIYIEEEEEEEEEQQQQQQQVLSKLSSVKIFCRIYFVRVFLLVFVFACLLPEIFSFIRPLCQLGLPIVPLQWSKTPSNEYPGYNNKLYLCWSSGKCRIPLQAIYPRSNFSLIGSNCSGLI